MYWHCHLHSLFSRWFLDNESVWDLYPVQWEHTVYVHVAVVLCVNVSNVQYVSPGRNVSTLLRKYYISVSPCCDYVTQCKCCFHNSRTLNTQTSWLYLSSYSPISFCNIFFIATELSANVHCDRLLVLHLLCDQVLCVNVLCCLSIKYTYVTLATLWFKIVMYSTL
jgi:hypothetical protein